MKRGRYQAHLYAVKTDSQLKEKLDDMVARFFVSCNLSFRFCSFVFSRAWVVVMTCHDIALRRTAMHCDAAAMHCDDAAMHCDDAAMLPKFKQ